MSDTNNDNQISITKELPPTGLVRRSQFKGIVPVSDATIWRWVKDGRFPQPLRVSPRLRLWNVADLREWMRVGPDAWLAAHPQAAESGAA
ncbi:helix-turn-helix transcriptional regulator [Paraburkholderia sp. BR13439]|uniref:helix-turn-helix transcriptional regulator n=1 Tax=Paraburkholderia sp. BR13439 TaxID=3236996 RepID=UPI0034CE6EEC